MARKSFLLRIDAEVHDALKRWADDELRSLNGQIEFLLRSSLLQRKRLRQPQPGSESDGRDESSDDA